MWTVKTSESWAIHRLGSPKNFNVVMLCVIDPFLLQLDLDRNKYWEQFPLVLHTKRGLLDVLTLQEVGCSVEWSGLISSDAI